MRKATNSVSLTIITIVTRTRSSFTGFHNRTRGDDRPRPRRNTVATKRSDHQSTSSVPTTSTTNRKATRQLPQKATFFTLFLRIKLTRGTTTGRRRTTSLSTTDRGHVRRTRTRRNGRRPISPGDVNCVSSSRLGFYRNASSSLFHRCVASFNVKRSRTRRHHRDQDRVGGVCVHGHAFFSTQSNGRREDPRFQRFFVMTILNFLNRYHPRVDTTPIIPSFVTFTKGRSRVHVKRTTTLANLFPDRCVRSTRNQINLRIFRWPNRLLTRTIIIGNRTSFNSTTNALTRCLPINGGVLVIHLSRPFLIRGSVKTSVVHVVRDPVIQGSTSGRVTTTRNFYYDCWFSYRNVSFFRTLDHFFTMSTIFINAFVRTNRVNDRRGKLLH